MSVVDESLLSVSSNSACLCEIAFCTPFTKHCILPWNYFQIAFQLSSCREDLYRSIFMVFSSIWFGLRRVGVCFGAHTLHQKASSVSHGFMLVGLIKDATHRTKVIQFVCFDPMCEYSVLCSTFLNTILWLVRPLWHKKLDIKLILEYLNDGAAFLIFV